MFVYGFDPEFAPALGLPTLADGVGYTAEGTSSAIDLKVAVVTADPEGYSSASVSRQRLACRGVLKRAQLDYLFGGVPGNSMIVNTATFARIASTMYAMEWDRVRRSWELGELPMTPLLGGITVYLSTIDGVRSAARRLQGAGYSVDYGLRAFDDLAASLRRSTGLATGLVLLFLAGAGGYVLVSWRAYLRLSRRDIGILKHLGIPADWIRAGYARRLLLACLTALAACFVAALVAGALTFGPISGAAIGLVNWAFVSVVLLAMWKIASRIVVGRQVNVDTLALLTKEREFQ